ncbi:uncharacterized protein METZ01_LOCUS180891, partial [marine metagenome]
MKKLLEMRGFVVTNPLGSAKKTLVLNPHF